MLYSDEELISLSGIQHYYFCKRQWALIHIEQQWVENRATMEGRIVHEKADDPFVVESRKDYFISRAVPLASYSLGFYGIADIIEFKLDSNGVRIKDRDGMWIPNIVEYKRGKSKSDERDIVQLVAQVICLEEMLNCKISTSDLFYNETKKRRKVDITEQLREKVLVLSNEMQKIYKNKITPNAESGKHCKSCSMVGVCLPRMTNKKVNVKNYIERYIKLGGEDN